MSNQRNGPPPTSKPTTPSGIRPPDLQALSLKFEALEKLVRESFDEKNQWNSTVRDWIGKKIVIRLVDGTLEIGKLRWMDRYTICLEDDGEEPVVVHKGAIATLRPSKG